MECYHYVNIFETKGLEYILVIVFLITLVLFMRHVSPHTRSTRSSAGPTLGPTDKLVVPGPSKVSKEDEAGSGHQPERPPQQDG